jgi:hypothetical protein
VNPLWISSNTKVAIDDGHLQDQGIRAVANRNSVAAQTTSPGSIPALLRVSAVIPESLSAEEIRLSA